MALTTRLPSPTVEPFYGFVDTTGDALRLIQAARQGLIPRITRRLNDLERRAMIRSGSVFVFSNEESGIRRWTEGLSWSASRIVGNFLVYREVLDRSLARGGGADGERQFSRRRINMDHLSSAEQAEKRLEKSLVGCLADGLGRFKVDGMIKKTITVKIEGSEHHLVAYYKQEDVRLGRLPPLSTRTDIMSLGIPPELLESTKFRFPPRTEPGPDGRPRYICDSDETDSFGARFQSPFGVDAMFIQHQQLPQQQLLPQPTVLGSPIALHSPVASDDNQLSTCTASSSSAFEAADLNAVFGTLSQFDRRPWMGASSTPPSEWSYSAARKTSQDEQLVGCKRSRMSSVIHGKNRYAPYAAPKLQLSSLVLPADHLTVPELDFMGALSAASDVSFATADYTPSRSDRYHSTPPSTPSSASSNTSPSGEGSPSDVPFALRTQSIANSSFFGDSFESIAAPLDKNVDQTSALYPLPFTPHVVQAADVNLGFTVLNDDYAAQFAWVMN